MAANAEIQQARVDLAAAFRLAARLGLNEGICNHFSMRVPGTEDRFLINAYGLHWSEITASNLIVVDDSGDQIEGEGEVELTAITLHTGIHKAHAGATCVLHTHMPYATAIACLDKGRLEPLSLSGLRFYHSVGYDDDFDGPATEESEGERTAAKLGNKSILFMANHGVMVTGPTVARAFDDLYYLERACQVQVLAMSTGRPLRIVPDDVVRASRRQLDMLEMLANNHFTAMKRILDRDEPDYAS